MIILLTLKSHHAKFSMGMWATHAGDRIPSQSHPPKQWRVVINKELPPALRIYIYGTRESNSHSVFRVSSPPQLFPERWVQKDLRSL